MINKAILVGRLGADPEVRYTPDGAMVTNFRIATDEQWKDKNGEKVQKTEWHKIVTFGKLAEICGKYLVKGKLVYLEGRIQTRAWDDKEGVKRYTTEIVASNMQMLDSKGQQGRRRIAGRTAASPSRCGRASARGGRSLLDGLQGFFSSVFFSAAGVTSISFGSRVAFLKFLMPRPSALPISGSLPAPKMIRMITRMISNSGMPIPNICFQPLSFFSWQSILDDRPCIVKRELLQGDFRSDPFSGRRMWMICPCFPRLPRGFPWKVRLIPPALPMSSWK